MSLWDRFCNWLRRVFPAPIRGASPAPKQTPAPVISAPKPIEAIPSAPVSKPVAIQILLGSGDQVDIWKTATVRPQYAAEVKKAVARIQAMMPTYALCSKACGLPELLLGLIHSKEGGCNPKACFQNGDLIIGTGKLTEHVPKNRGPFATLEASAVEAFQGKSVANNLQAILTYLFHFNGIGYSHQNPPINSPYLWACTTAYTKGHYVQDGVYDQNAIDQDPGCAAILKVMQSEGLIEIID